MVKRLSQLTAKSEGKALLLVHPFYGERSKYLLSEGNQGETPALVQEEVRTVLKGYDLHCRELLGIIGEAPLPLIVLAPFVQKDYVCVKLNGVRRPYFEVITQEDSVSPAILDVESDYYPATVKKFSSGANWDSLAQALIAAGVNHLSYVAGDGMLCAREAMRCLSKRGLLGEIRSGLVGIRTHNLSAIPDGQLDLF